MDGVAHDYAAFVACHEGSPLQQHGRPEQYDRQLCRAVWHAGYSSCHRAVLLRFFDANPTPAAVARGAE